MRKKIMIVLGTNPTRDADKLLQLLIARLSIPRNDWVQGKCFSGNKKELSGKKAERLKQMSNDIISLKALIDLNRPCVIVGMGKIPCEVLTDASLLNSRAGSCWSNRLSGGKAWITHSPEAALFNPSLAVEISGILVKAAELAGIETKFNPKVSMFLWEEYERKKFNRGVVL